MEDEKKRAVYAGYGTNQSGYSGLNNGYGSMQPSYQGSVYDSAQTNNSANSGLNYGYGSMQPSYQGSVYDSTQINNGATIGRANHYSIQAPPTNVYSGPSQEPEQQTKPFSWRKCMVNTMAFIIACGFFIGIVFLFRLSRPKLEVESISVSSFNVSNSQITGNWDIDIRMKSRNVNEVYYQNVEVSVYYKDQFLSGTVLEPFQLVPKGKKLLQAKIAASANKLDNWVANSIMEEKAGGAVTFNVQLQASDRSVQGEPLTMVNCRDLKVGFSSNTTTGTMLGRPRKCKGLL